MSYTPFLFILCGGFTTVINIVSRYLLSFYLPYSAAIIIAYSLGLGIAFYLYKKIVYRASDSNNTKQEIVLYLLVNAVGLLVTLAASLLFKNTVFPTFGFHYYPQDIAHLIGVVCGAVANYFGHKRVTFRKAWR